jgi:hypothetical protein
MADLTLIVVFGVPGGLKGWAVQKESEEPPLLGYRATFRLMPGEASSEINHVGPDDYDYDEGEDEVVAQVLFTCEVGSKGDHLAYLYGGQDVPEEYFADRLTNAGWEEIASEDALEIYTVCSQMPPMAGYHNVLLLVGDPESEKFQAWSRSTPPDSPFLPIFGQRVLFDVIENLDLDDDTHSHRKDEPCNCPVNNNTDIRALEGNMKEGLPSIVLYSETVGPGIADVIFWTKGLGDVDGIDMISKGWEMVATPDEFNPAEFEIKRRVEYAHRIKFEMKEDEEGDQYIDNYYIEDFKSIPVADYEYITSDIIQRGLATLDLDNIESELAKWTLE